MQIILTLILAVVLCVATADVVPATWPDQFSIRFESNITTSVEQPVKVIPGIMFYDWNIKSQRVDHGAGSYECVHFYNSNAPCTIFFKPKGLYRILYGELNGAPKCCLDMEGLGAVAPDWSAAANPSYNGIVTDLYSGQQAHQFTYDNLPSDGTEPSKEPHMSREIPPEDPSYPGAPLLFTFPGDEGRQDYHYVHTTMKVGPQEAALFALPDGCDVPCASASSRSQHYKH